MRANGLHGEAVAEDGVMSRLVEARRRELQPGRVHPDPVTEFDESPELVDREEVLDPIRETLRHVARVIGKGFGGLARLPPADPVMERLRQVPVVEGGEGLDAVLEQFVNEAVVKVE